jgi:hypothetical protein
MNNLRDDSRTQPTPCLPQIQVAKSYPGKFAYTDNGHTMSAMPGPYFNKETIRKFLAEHGYATHPKGLIELFPVDFSEIEGVGYLDIHAEAVRRGNEVPDRPIRLTFHKITTDPSSQWELRSVEELSRGVQSKCLD